MLPVVVVVVVFFGLGVVGAVCIMCYLLLHEGCTYMCTYVGSAGARMRHVCRVPYLAGWLVCTYSTNVGTRSPRSWCITQPAIVS